jgi:thiol-disulfide isomerase/thioredoxin
MKQRITLVLAVIMGASLALPAQENEGKGIKFMTNEPWEQALQQAKEQNRLIFMDCYTVWCGPCKGLADNIFPREDVGNFFNANFVNVQYDMEKGDGKMLNEKYKEYIIGYPTLLLINADGQVIHQMAGYQEADALINGMKAGLEGRSLFAARTRYEEGARDLETVTAYVDALTGAYLTEEVAKVALDFLATLPPERLNDDEVWRIVGKHVKDPYTEHYKFLLHNKLNGKRYGADRYALENQLGTAMRRAVDEIMHFMRTSSNADTLRQMQEREGKLKELLQKYSCRDFTACLAKFEINDRIFAGDLQGALDFLRITRQLRLLTFEGRFLEGSYRVLIDRTRDKKFLRGCLDELLVLQGMQSSRVEFAYNYYGLIADAREKLGERDKAKVDRAEFERREVIRKEQARKLFGDLVDQ